MGTAEGLAIQSTLRIANKKAQDADFILNPAQYQLDCAVQRTKQKGWPVRFWVPKARQEGVSSYVLARFTVKALAMRNRNVRIVAHTTIATQRMLAKVKYFLKHMKGPEVTLHYNTKNEITFPDTDSSISIYTAGSPEAARSDTITDLHNSEVAFWPDPEDMAAALFETVPDEGGEIFNESTGNGAMTWYHKNCLYAQGIHYDAQLCFLPWHTFPDYQIPYDIAVHGRLELLEEFEEPDLIKQFPLLTPGQLLWRRIRIRRHSMNIPLFKQENPMVLAECFMAAKTSFFHKVFHTPGSHWRQIDKTLWIREGFPRKDMHYSLGVDVSAGVGLDRSVIEVICYETGEQVAEYVSDTIAPDALAVEIENLGKMFSWEYQDKKDYNKRLMCYPVLVVESNNYGIATLQALDERRIYPRKMVYWDGRASNFLCMGLLTTKKNKPMHFAELRRDLALGEISFSSDELMGELSAFTGELEAMDGSFDDRVMAFCMAFIGLKEMPRLVAGQALAAPIYGGITHEVPFDPKDFSDSPTYEAQPLMPQYSLLEY